jgi:signal transduction histidine kinase
MRRIVDDLRTYARLARYEPARERVPLAALVANVIDAHAEVIEASGATVHIDGDLPIVVGDATLIEWILTQLVDNALAFVQSDRVAEVRIGATVTGDRVRLSVTDRGPGILRDNQARVFHLFERLGRDDVAGSGIGLPIAQRSAELMGTRVRLESELGEGSTFSIELPLARGAS